MKPRVLAAFLFLFFASSSASVRAQQETFVPITLNAAQTEIHLWTSGAGVTYARVKLTFAHGGFRVTDWGEPTRNGNNFAVDIKPEQWTGLSTQAIMYLTHVYELGTLPSGSYSFNVNSRGAAVRSEQFDPSQIVEHWQLVAPSRESTYLAIRTTGGVTFTFVTLYPTDQPRRITDWGNVARNGNDYAVDIRVEEWTGAPATNQSLERRAYSLGPTPPGAYSFTLKANGEVVRTQPFNVSAGQSSPFANPLEDPHYFVRQHYLDFLGREPESGGLSYWADQFVQCGISESCVHEKRIGVSAAFFMADENQAVGGFVYRLYKGTLSRRPTLAEFNSDRDRLPSGPGLETAKEALVNEWVTRPEFLGRWPETMSAEEFVRGLYDSAGLRDVAASEKAQATANLQSGTESRAQVVRGMIELKAFRDAEYNPSFVLMQYFDYLRREPEEAGYQFWLGVLNNRDPNNFRGMVCSFITSAEYQLRFGSTVTRTNQDCK